MRHLTLLRHAQAQDAPPGGRDIDRPLTDKGYRDARAAARALEKAIDAPDLIVASPAVRTVQTATLVLDRAFPHAALITEPRLYLASGDVLRDYVRGLGDGFAKVLLVGHNPGLSDLAAHLAGDHGHDALGTAEWRRFQCHHDRWRERD